MELSEKELYHVAYKLKVISLTLPLFSVFAQPKYEHGQFQMNHFMIFVFTEVIPYVKAKSYLQN